MQKKRDADRPGRCWVLIAWTSFFLWIMAKASVKRIGKLWAYHNSRIWIDHITASQNESTVKTLKLGLFLPTFLSLVLRFLFRRDSLPPSKGSITINIAASLPAFFLSNYLIKIGQPRRDPTTGTLISYGEDLSQPGVTEWCFDILYITCKCVPILITCSKPFGIRALPNRQWGVWWMVLVVLYSRKSAMFLVLHHCLNPLIDPSLRNLQTVDLCNIPNSSRSRWITKSCRNWHGKTCDY